MNDVTLQMIDVFTGKQVQRTIDITNAMTDGEKCLELRDEQSQRVALQSWINERGNQQHEAMLDLVSWSFS